jgi:hypothetical protein
MLYAAAAVERAMKVQEVICRVLAGTLTWLQGQALELRFIRGFDDADDGRFTRSADR